MCKEEIRLLKETYSCAITNRTEDIVVKKTTAIMVHPSQVSGALPFTVKNIETCSGIDECGVRKIDAHGFNNDWSRCPLVKTMFSSIP